MMSAPRVACVTALLASSGWQAVFAQGRDAHLREVWYDAQAVIPVPVKRGVVTHIVLDASEAITDVGTGIGADCAKVEMSWCVAAQAGGHHLFVKPKTAAKGSNNIAVVTDRRTYSFRLDLLDDADRRAPAYRMVIRIPVRTRPGDALAGSLIEPLVGLPANATPSEQIRERLAQAPTVRNSNYSLSEGAASADIVPTLVFDDGRFTYLRFPNNRVVPAVFDVLADGSESLANARMEGDFLVADRVSRRLVLRAGTAVVGLWNDAFDIDGVSAIGGATVPGVRRQLKAHAPEPTSTSVSARGDER